MYENAMRPAPDARKGSHLVLPYRQPLVAQAFVSMGMLKRNIRCRYTVLSTAKLHAQVLHVASFDASLVLLVARSAQLGGLVDSIARCEDVKVHYANDAFKATAYVAQPHH